MSKIVRIKDTYPNYTNESLSGVKAVVIRGELDDVLIGFPLESPYGWYDSTYSTEYRCWWISSDYLEPITTITRSKFK